MQGKVFPTRDGDQLVYTFASGSKPDATIIFLNGSFFNHHQWDLLFSRLSRKAREQGKNFDYLFIDYRGFGNVAPLSHPFTFDAIQEDVLDLLDTEHVGGDVRIVGSSLGSLVGLSLLDREPSKISSLFAYGFVPPAMPVIQHVREVFTRVKAQLATFLSSMPPARMDEATITPFAKAMWDTFVLRYSRTVAAIKARGYNDAYATYILKYMKGTPATTIASFLDFFTSESIVEMIGKARFSPSLFKKVTVFHGTDDLIAPFPDVKAFCDAVQVHQFLALQGKGHTDIILDGSLCDAIAATVLADRP
ncbi:MAG: alpha/beta hydrolase [Candidatus Lokiarchaeota archaeon]|nr:alpha/beta hydrolase [Candidatus Lokiarchaeota archaeon]